ncbi:hypothetical protein E2C01_080659 [Portunus trituberculatus]|uniref:Uncharacterized protein n=1 Tax=Portunus trituberculatus TaxID=210409 RepID=A0A5B7IK86_PORTR|nr:hypothetical protein [Portunus trituberculatus]
MGWLKAGGAGPGGGGAGSGLRGTRACWVTSWVTMEVSRTLTALWILLAVTQLPGKCGLSPDVPTALFREQSLA